MRRAKGYQDLDDSAVGPRPPAPLMPPPQEIEMASVSVVPDGMCYGTQLSLLLCFGTSIIAEYDPQCRKNKLSHIVMLFTLISWYFNDTSILFSLLHTKEMYELMTL